MTEDEEWSQLLSVFNIADTEEQENKMDWFLKLHWHWDIENLTDSEDGTEV